VSVQDGSPQGQSINISEIRNNLLAETQHCSTLTINAFDMLSNQLKLSQEMITSLKSQITELLKKNQILEAKSPDVPYAAGTMGSASSP